MSQCVVPNWNLSHQRQEQVEGEGNNRSSHVHSHSQHHHLSSGTGHLVPNPMSNYEVAELTWENGQLAMHGLGGLLPSAPTKPTWGRSNDTLESIVHNATYHKQNLNVPQQDHQTPANISSMVASSGSGGKLAESSSQVPVVPGLLKKRTRLDSDQCGRKFNGSIQEERADRSACASATFCRDNDTTMMTWASYESPRSLKTSKTADEDSTSHGGSENRDDEDHETRGEIGRSQSTRRSRAAAIHNQSERRRRDRINQKMKALQKLVPNASKTDKASMLDEVIEYLKQLQAQVQMMSMRTPQMMMPLGMQQHLQMSSLLARMGMGVGLGMGMGMLDMNTMARNSSQTLPSLIHPSSSTHTFVPPPFIVPPMIPMRAPTQPNQDPRTNSPVPLPDPYCAFLAQSMNIDLYNKMAALYQQQVNQTTQASSSPSQSNHVQGE